MRRHAHTRARFHIGNCECGRETIFSKPEQRLSPGESFVILSLPVAMKSRTFLCITLLVLCHPLLWSQAVTKQFPPSVAEPAGTGNAAQNRGGPYAAPIPVAHVVAPPPSGVPVRIEADTQSYAKTPAGVVFTLSGHVVIHYRDYVIQADRATYNQTSSEVVAEGHLRLDGGPDEAHLLASHGEMNLNAHTARIYDVAGTLHSPQPQQNAKILTSTNPFAVSARELVQTGPKQYKVIDGAVTSCALPNPDWQIAAKEFLLSNDTATAKNSVFELRGLPLLHRVPVFYLPYVTHSVTGKRESGFLMAPPKA